MPSIQKPALRTLATELKARHDADPSIKVDAKVLDQIIAIVGDRWLASSASVADKLKNGDLLPEEKLALAKKGLDASEKKDIEALLADSQFAPLLDPVASNFLKALVGLEPLKAMDGVGGIHRVDAVSSLAQTPEAKAVSQFKEILKSGKLQNYYDAATGRASDPQLKAEAEKLFASLPKINAETSADELVALGLWTTKPRGIQEMQKSARFLPGRQVIVPTTVNGDVKAGRSFLAYKKDGVKGLTYRATLQGEDGDNYLVKIDGAPELIKIAKSEVHRLNQPHKFSGDTIRLAKTVDYNSMYMKAKLCEAALKTDALVQKLDFTKMKTEVAGGAIGAVFGRGVGAQKMSEIQRKAVRVIHDCIDMKYPKGSVYNEPGRSSGSDAGRLAMRGIGSCYMQASVMLGMLLPFSDKLGVDIQFISGGVYRHVDDSKPADVQMRSYASQAHGWLHLTYRPSMELRICDRTWQQPDHPADRAYSRWGDRYPTTFYRSTNTQPISDTDVNFSGDVSVATFDRQFATRGVDGRDNHQ